MERLTDPLLLLFLLALGMLVGLWRGRTCSRCLLGLLTLLFACLTAVCTPAVVFLMLGSLEWPYPPGTERPADAAAIVVLSGRLRPLDAKWDRIELGQDTLYRCLLAVEVYQQSGRCLLFVSGGKVNPQRPGPTLARAMATFLVEQGVAADDLVLEEALTFDARECGGIGPSAGQAGDRQGGAGNRCDPSMAVGMLFSSPRDRSGTVRFLLSGDCLQWVHLVLPAQHGSRTRCQGCLA